MRFQLPRRGAADAHLRRGAGPADVLVERDVLRGADIDAQPSRHLVASRLVQELLIPGRSSRAPFDGEVVRAFAEPPALPAGTRLGPELGGPGLAKIFGAAVWARLAVGSIERAPQALEVAPVRGGDDRDRSRRAGA